MKLQNLLKATSLSCALIISTIAMPTAAVENTANSADSSQSTPKQPSLTVNKPQSGPQAINGGLNRDIIRRRY